MLSFYKEPRSRPINSAKSIGTLSLNCAVDKLQNPLPRTTILFEGDRNSTGGRNDVFQTAEGFGYTFVFYKEKLYEKMRLKWSKSKENLKKIMRFNFQNLVFLLAKNRYFVVIAFKVLKMEFKFKYTTLITKVQPILASLFQ